MNAGKEDMNANRLRNKKMYDAKFTHLLMLNRFEEISLGFVFLNLHALQK